MATIVRVHLLQNYIQQTIKDKHNYLFAKKKDNLFYNEKHRCLECAMLIEINESRFRNTFTVWIDISLVFFET